MSPIASPIPPPVASPACPWPTELELLLACARLQMRPEDRRRADAAIRRGIDWDRLFRFGSAHGLLALFHRHASSGAVPVPPGYLAPLREATAANTRHSLHLASELMVLLRACAAHQIPVLPLKGPVLAQRVYGSVGLRHIRDLDLLFRESDLPLVVRLLEERGYRRQRRHPPAFDELAHRSSNQMSVKQPTGTFRVELHHYLMPPTEGQRYDFDAIRPRLECVPFLGLQVLALRPEDLLVYLCEHGAAHAWSRLEWIATVAELLRCGRIRDWHRVRECSAAFRAGRRVNAAILLANELLGTLEGVITVSGDRWSRAANRAIVRRLGRDPTRISTGPDETFAYQFLTATGLWTRVRRCWRALIKPTTSDALALPLPRAWWPAYYIVRPVRMLLRQAKRAASQHGGHGRIS